MDLKLKRFIETHDNWYSLLTNPPYNVTIKEDPNQHLFLFKYTQDTVWNKEDKEQYALLQECRGTIYYVKDGTVECVHMGLKKFFNLEEPNNNFHPDLSQCEIYQKIDGSNVSFWFWNGEWHCSSLGCIDAAEAKLSCGRSLAELVDDALSVPWKEYCKKNLYYVNDYVCELTHPDNTIVIQYNEPQLWLICVRCRNFQWEEDQYFADELVKHHYGFRTIPKYSFSSIESILAAAKALPEDEEGYVVRDTKTNARVKVKGMKYLELHHMRGNGVFNLKTYLEMRANGILDDFLGAFPHHGETAAKFARAFAAMVKNYDANWDFAYDNYRAKYGWTNNSACFARTIQSHAYKPYLFARWNGKVKNAQEFFAAMRPSQQLKHLESYMEDTQFESIREEEAH